MNWRYVAEEFSLSQGGCLFNFFLTRGPNFFASRFAQCPLAWDSAKLVPVHPDRGLARRLHWTTLRVKDFLYTVSAEELFQPQENEKGTQKQQELWLPSYCRVWNDWGIFRLIRNDGCQPRSHGWKISGNDVTTLKSFLSSFSSCRVRQSLLFLRISCKRNPPSQTATCKFPAESEEILLRKVPMNLRCCWWDL